MAAILQTRTLFSQLKLERGNTTEFTSLAPVLIFATHWTSAGQRVCTAERGNCRHCTERTSTPRMILLIPVIEIGGRAPKLLIASTLATQWAHDTQDIHYRHLRGARAKANNLLRIEDLGPTERWIDKSCPTIDWAATLFATPAAELTQ